MTDSNAQHIIDRLKAAGMSPVGIAGIMGNLMAESNFNPQNRAPNGAYGIAQWMGSRQDNLRQYAASQHCDISDLDTQIGFMIKEAQDSGIWPKMLQAAGPSDAATIWEQQYEQAGSGPDVHLAERIDTANQFFNDLNLMANVGNFDPFGISTAFKDIAAAIGATFGGIKTVTNALTSRAWWKRIGIGLVGILLIAMAIIETQKGTISTMASKAV